MTLNAVIARFATGVYEVFREPSGTLVDGELLPATTVDDIAIASVDAALDTLTSVAHGLVTGDGPFRLVGGVELGGGATFVDLPEPLSDAVEYWAIRVDDDTLRLALSEADALAAVFVDLTSSGSGSLALSTSGFQLVLCVQPATGRDLEALPESDRTSEVKLVFSATDLRTRMPGHEPDVITILGETYTVITSERWDHWGETHWRCLATRDEVT